MLLLAAVLAAFALLIALLCLAVAVWRLTARWRWLTTVAGLAISAVMLYRRYSASRSPRG